MEADRMVNSKILAEELKKEFSVVRNEFEIGENSPGGVLNERVISAMYVWHNYGNSTIGSKEDIERVKAENLKAFYKKYYQPDNAILIIAGKFDEKKALAYTQQYFGPIPKPTRVLQPTYTVEPSQDGEREVSLRRNGDIQYLAMGFHTPSTADKDYAANDALIEILTNDPSGILYKKLVETKMASKISGYTLPLHDPGYTYFQCEVPKDKSLDSAKQVFLQTANEIAAMNITEEDLARAKNNRLKYISNTTNNTINLAISLTELIGAGDWRLWFWLRDQVEKLTLEDVRDAARKYYKPSNRTFGYFVPDKAPDRTVVAETPNIAALLNGYKGKEVTEKKLDFDNTIPNIKKNTVYGKLANGAKYALLYKPTKGDKINADITLQMGDENSLAHKTEVANMVARLLKSGTTTKTKKQLTDELDRIKTEINFYPSAGKLTVSLNTDKANLDAALALLDDMLHNPKFDQGEFDKAKIDAQTDYESNKSDPQNVSFSRLSKLISKYPEGHPYYAADADEQLIALSKVKLDDVKKFYNDFYGGNNSITSFVGEIDKDKTLGFLQKSLGNWNSKSPYKQIEVKYFDVKGGTESVNIPDKTNAVLIGAINLNISEKSPDFPAIYMANELLGGGAFLSSRIPQRLRENEGMSYGAGSFLSPNYTYNSTMWGLYAAYNPVFKNRLDSALRQEIDKARAGGFTKEELSKSVDSYLEQNKTNLGINNYLSSMINNYLRLDRDLDDYTKMESQIKALNTDAVNAALRKYFDLSKLVIVNAGDFIKKGF